MTATEITAGIGSALAASWSVLAIAVPGTTTTTTSAGTPVDGLIETTNIVAAQSDRWLFVAMLILGILAMGWMVKYFTSQLSAARIDIDAARKEFTAYLQAANAEMTKALARNTEIIERMEGMLKK